MNAVIVGNDQDSMKVLKCRITEIYQNVEVRDSLLLSRKVLEQLTTSNPDIVFLDIEALDDELMGLLLEFSRFNINPIIFTSSTDRFALQAIKLSAIDYLVKPFEKHEVFSAMNKVKLNRVARYKDLSMGEVLGRHYLGKPNTDARVALATADQLLFVESNKIIYCTSDSNYTKINLTNGETVVLSKTLKEVEEPLLKRNFFRVHASYLINLDHVLKFSRKDGGYLIMSNGDKILVAKTRRGGFFQTFEKI